MRYQKILLVSVAYKNSVYKPGDVPELGLGYIAQYLVQNGFEYDVLDMNLGYTFEDLANKINMLLSINASSYNKMTKSCRELAIEKLDMSVIVKQYEQIL